MNFRQWFLESDPGPVQMAPANGPNPMQIPISLHGKSFPRKKPKPLGELTPNFPNDNRDFMSK